MQPNRAPLDASLVAAFIVLLIFVTPLKDWWSQGRPAWYLPFLLWGLAILLAMALQWWARRR